MIKFPVYVFEGSDLNIYDNYIDPGNVEEQDVAHNIFRCFDSDGFVVELRYEKHELIIKCGPLASDEFRARLIQTLNSLKEPLPSNATMQYLKDRVWNVFGVF